MKNKNLIISIICFAICILMAIVAYADITLPAPQEIIAKKDATVIKLAYTNHDVEAKTISVTLRYYTAGGEGLAYLPVCIIKDTDYTNVMNDTVSCPTDDTKKKSTLWNRKLQNKCKNILNLTGTEN